MRRPEASCRSLEQKLLVMAKRACRRFRALSRLGETLAEANGVVYSCSKSERFWKGENSAYRTLVRRAAKVS